MLLSELIKEDPRFDIEIDLDNGPIILDMLCLFRVIDKDDELGQGTFFYKATEHTDGIVSRGLVRSAAEIQAGSWHKENND